MKKFILLSTLFIIASAFTPAIREKPDPDVSTVKFSYFKINDKGVNQVVETYQVKETDVKQFIQNWHKQHGIKMPYVCCTVTYDPETCACIEKCCAWGGIDLGEVCTEHTVSCVGSPQVPCD